jgi:hypothetical protein
MLTCGVRNVNVLLASAFAIAGLKSFRVFLENVSACFDWKLDPFALRTLESGADRNALGFAADISGGDLPKENDR